MDRISACQATTGAVATLTDPQCVLKLTAFTRQIPPKHSSCSCDKSGIVVTRFNKKQM